MKYVLYKSLYKNKLTIIGYDIEDCDLDTSRIFRYKNGNYRIFDSEKEAMEWMNIYIKPELIEQKYLLPPDDYYFK